MEQSRIIVAIALSFLVFLVWDYFFIDKEATQQAKQQQQVQTEKAPDASPGPESVKEPAATPGSIATAPVATPAPATGKAITVNAPLYQVKISEAGAVFTQFLLKDFRETVAEDSPLKNLISAENKRGSLMLSTGNTTAGTFENAIFQSDASLGVVDVLDSEQSVRFSWTSPQGVTFVKQYTFYPDSYRIGLKIQVNNQGESLFQDRVSLSLNKHFDGETTAYGFQGPSGLIDGDLERVDIDDIDEKNQFSGDIKWIALQDRYFMQSILPVNSPESEMRLKTDDSGLVVNQFVEAPVTINPGSEQAFEFIVFFGPKSTRVLNTFENDLAKAVNFGMFDILAKPCLWLMNFIYDNLIPNYGIAIIILTIITKLILWPLGNKSYKSMGEMKKIQPLINDIKERYKDDKKKMNEEVMKLYKTYKVNPMGGCLPMVVQIPVFFALYRMLYEAIELRHAPFFGWINDLSAPDRLFHFDFSIPFMEPPYGIPVLTIVMGASMFLQQKMTPSMGDSTQAKMMMLMPIIFTVIFINFSSGLVLYWLVNNIISMSQQYFIQKKSAR